VIACRKKVQDPWTEEKPSMTPFMVLQHKNNGKVERI
jgi:hypothetical protein